MLLTKRISSHTFPILVGSQAIQGDNPKTKRFSISVAVGPSSKKLLQFQFQTATFCIRKSL